jgi:broad specificity phosphatase PhoE
MGGLPTRDRSDTARARETTTRLAAEAGVSRSTVERAIEVASGRHREGLGAPLRATFERCFAGWAPLVALPLA